MAFQECPNTLSVVVRGNMGGRDTDMMNVWHCYTAETLTQADTDDISTHMAELYDALRAYVAVDVSYNDVVVTDLRTLGAPQFTSTAGWPKVGTSVAEGLADFCAIKMKLAVAGRGPWYRGHVFFTGLTVDAADGNSVSAGAAAALNEGMDDIVASMSADNHDLGILSRTFQKNARAHGLFQTPLVAYGCAPYLSALRERRVGG